MNNISTFDIYIAMTLAFVTASVVMEVGYALIQILTRDQDE